MCPSVEEILISVLDCTKWYNAVLFERNKPSLFRNDPKKREMVIHLATVKENDYIIKVAGERVNYKQICTHLEHDSSKRQVGTKLKYKNRNESSSNCAS